MQAQSSENSSEERKRLFEVLINYREPSFELTLPARPAAPYRCRLRVWARNPDEARQRAIWKFQAQAELSSVGWVRQVVGCEIEELPVPGMHVLAGARKRRHP